MKLLYKLLSILLPLSAILCINPAHAVVVDLSGIAVDDEVILFFDEDEFLQPNFDIGFWFEMESIDLNFPSDLRIELENSFHLTTYTLTGNDCGFPSPDLPGIYECDHFINILENSVPGDEWQITIFDIFRDNLGPDYRFLEGSFIAWGDDLHLINGTKVPTPSILALLAVGLVGLGFAGRRKA